jgi:hypothetical protein
MTMLQVGWPRNKDSIPVWERDFFLLPSIQTSSGVYPASFPIDTVSSVPERKVVGIWSWPRPSSAEVKNGWNYTTIPLYIYMMWYFIKSRDNLHGHSAYFHLWYCGSSQITTRQALARLKNPCLSPTAYIRDNYSNRFQLILYCHSLGRF